MMQLTDTLSSIGDTALIYRDSLHLAFVERSLSFSTMKVQDVVFLLFFFSLVITAFVLARNRKMLWDRALSLFQTRSSSFSFQRDLSKNVSPSFQIGSRRNPSQDGNDQDRLWLLFIPAGILTALLLVHAQGLIVLDADFTDDMMKMLSLGVAACLSYLILKVAVYKVVGWVFLDGDLVSTCISAYSTLVYMYALLMLPLSLLCVYIPIDPSVTLWCFLLTLVFLKVLIFFMWVKYFCQNFYGSLLIILYFCALEIIPILFLGLGVSSYIIL